MWPFLWNILKFTINLKAFSEGLNNENTSKFLNVLQNTIQQMVFACKNFQHNEMTTNSWD
jgi:hypothetical protein